ncbi:hypothetical protein L6R46_20195 [Myxococcota bacterium]|nr:hypothetical protein [Myxococcota bacterium]
MPLPRFEMTEAEELALIDELLDVLDQVIETSGCPDMAPLWLLATRAARAEYLRRAESLPLQVPTHIQEWAKSMRSKYAGLAAWRHSVLLEGLLGSLDPPLASAVEAIYFTPAEQNRPPYSWSRASSRHPRASEWSSASVLDLRARRGCLETVMLIQQRVDAARGGASLVVEARTKILETGARDGTLRDVLRYDALARGGVK